MTKGTLDMEPGPLHGNALRAGRWSEDFACYAVTKCTKDRQPVLVSCDTAQVILDSLDYMRSANHIRLLAF